MPEQNWNSQSICDALYQQEVPTLWGRRGQEWAQRRSLKRMLNTRGAGAGLAVDRAAGRWEPCSHLSHPFIVSAAQSKVTPRPQHPVVKACGRHHQSRAAAFPSVPASFKHPAALLAGTMLLMQFGCSFTKNWTRCIYSLTILAKISLRKELDVNSF